VCRFCLECEEITFEEEVDTPAGTRKDAFVHPCPCRGSAKFVHLDCLVQFFLSQGSWHNFKCPTCKQTYEGRALRKLAEISQERMAQDHGPQSPQVAHSMCYLAQAHSQLGDVVACKEVLERGLVILEGHFGRGHVATATLLAELATAYGKMGNVQMQKKLLERSLQVKEKHFGQGHINTAVTLNNLATAHSELGNIQHEKALLERSLEIKEKHYGKGHVQTTAALVNLAGIHSELGDVAKGLELLKWSLEIEERHYGEGHVETAITLNNLALAHGEAGDVQRMRDMLVRCLAIKEQHFGSQHQELCLTLANLGMACAALGEHAVAKTSCERALQICANQRPSRRFGMVSLRAASVHVVLGEDSIAAEQVDRAVSVLRGALGAHAKKALAVECARMRRIWVAVVRVDVAARLQEMLDERDVGGCCVESESLQWTDVGTSSDESDGCHAFCQMLLQRVLGQIRR